MIKKINDYKEKIKLNKENQKDIEEKLFELKEKEVFLLKELGKLIYAFPLENIDQKENKTKDSTLTLDLMKYNYTDSQLILALFDNGTIGIRDKLIKKSLVLAELEEQGVKEDDYVTLLRRLKKQNLVTFDVGYYANSSLVNIVNQQLEKVG